MVRGPFPKWLHQHVVTPEGPDACLLTDDIELELPFGTAGRVVGEPIARRALERLFTYRHGVTRRICEGPDASRWSRNGPLR
jgi:ligand-binding SRPBCC domain-containing protein